MTTKEFIDGCLVSLGIAGGASVVRAIFVPQEGSAWDKFIKFFGSVIFGAMVGVIIRHTETQGFLLQYVDYIVAISTLLANEIITSLVKKSVSLAWDYIEAFIRRGRKEKGDE